MTKQNKSTESQNDKNKQPQKTTESLQEGMNEQSVSPAIPGFVGLPSDGSSTSQTTTLKNPQWQIAQRQALATTIARRHGNQQLQRILASSNVIQRENGGGSMAGSASKITSADPDHLSQILEEVATQHGLDNAAKFVSDFQSSPQGAAADDEKLAKEINAGLQAQLSALQSKAEKMIQDFERVGLNVVSEMLNKSEEILHGEQEKYGVKELPPAKASDVGLEQADMHQQGGSGVYEASNQDQLQGLAEAAGKLMPKRQELDKLVAEQKGLVQETPVAMGHGGKMITDQSRYDALSQEIREKQIVFNMLRKKVEADFPILATYSQEGGAPDLAKVAQGPDIAGPMVVSAITEKLKNIERVREGVLNGEVKVWELPTIVNGTKANLGYGAGTLGGRLVDDNAKSEGEKSALTKMAWSAISIALGLVAAIPTAGASIGVAAGAVGAGISGMQALEALREYELADAMTGTDVDKARSISQTDPSLFWLALDIVSVIFDVPGALQVFKAIAPAVRSAFTARRAVATVGKESAEAAAKLADAQKAVDQLRTTAKSHLPDNVAEKIVKQVEGPQKAWIPDPDNPLSSGGMAGSLAGRKGCGVFEGHIPSVPDKTVVIKVYPADDPELVKVFEREMEGAAAASRTGSGPKFYGEVQMGPDKKAFAMEKVSGELPEDMTDGANPKAAAEAAKATNNITSKTYLDVQVYGRDLWNQGYYCHGDLQGMVDEFGNWRPIDFQGVYKRPPVEDAAATAKALKDHNAQINEHVHFLHSQAAKGPLPPPKLPPIQ